MGDVLDDIQDGILTLVDVNSLCVQDVVLGPLSNGCSFHFVQLNDGAVGACMTYYRFRSEDERMRIQSRLMQLRKRDPLLLEYGAKGDAPELLRLSLRMCVISALSRKRLWRNPLFRCRKTADWSFLSGIRSATVIGFGGYLEALMGQRSIERIHMSDLGYGTDRRGDRALERKMAEWRRSFPGKIVTVSDGSDNQERIESSDLVSITGSALCNGTMDRLLRHARKCRYVIVQGQSAAVLPLALFERGVSLVETTLKPAIMTGVARKDPERCRMMLEGGLSSIFMSPLTGF